MGVCRVMNQVAAVIVTYNRISLLKECIKNLLMQTVSCDILIVDNNSNDGTQQYIKDAYENFEHVLYRNMGSNLGGAGGFNYGMRWAVEKGYSFVWVMDDDCIPKKDALQYFLDFEKKNTNAYGYLSSKVLWKDHSVCKMNVQRKTMYRAVHDFESDCVPIVMASFVSLFIPAKIIKEVGLPIKEFFIWTDDWEFTRRISLKYKCYLLNNSVVMHKSINNVGASIVYAPINQLSRFNYLYRNDVYLYRREGFNGWIYEGIRLLFHIIRVLIFSKDNKIKRIQAIIYNSFRGILFKPFVEKVNKNDSVNGG